MKHKISEGSSLYRSSAPSSLLRPHSVPGNGDDAGKSAPSEVDPMRCEAVEGEGRGGEALLPLEMQVDGREAVFPSEVNDREEESDYEGEEYEKDDGEEEEEEEDEDEDEEAGEAAMEEEIGPADASEGEKPKLAEGFFEVEAIRRKRICKGEAQYFIKWRGWPESSNTWEPLEHLQLCPDIVETYEQSLQSGKKTRKRKRKYTQPKKKLQYTYASSGGKENNADVKKPRLGRRPSQNRTSNEPSYTPGSKQTEGDDNSNDKDDDTRKITIQLQEAAKGDGSPVNSSSKAEGTEPRQGDRRTGARRRKSGYVQRFKPESSAFDPNHPENSMPVNGPYDGTDHIDEYPNIKSDFPRDSSINRILKPIGYSTSKSDGTEDVLVSFVAARSDGKEVVVDNKFLRANYPHVLIDYYEQHLRYSPAT